MFETARINPSNEKVEVIGTLEYDPGCGWGYIRVDGYFQDGEFSGRIDIEDFDNLTTEEHKNIMDDIHSLVADNIDKLFVW